MPLTKEEKDMPKFGWTKHIVFDWIRETRDGKFIKTTYEAKSDMFPCPRCKTADFVWLDLRRTGLLWTCWGCKVTTGAMTTDVLVKIEEKEIDIIEAYKIAKANDQQDLKKMFPPSRIKLIQRMQQRKGKRKIKKTE